MFKKEKKIIILCEFITLLTVYIIFLPLISSVNITGSIFRFSMILYTSLSVIALFNLQTKYISRNNTILAIILGFLSIAICVPIENGQISLSLSGDILASLMFTNGITGVTVTLVYLLSCSLINQSRSESEIKINCVDNIFSTCVIMLVTILVFWVLTGFKTPTGRINILYVIQNISVGISEEVIFRLLPYSYVLFHVKKSSYTKILSFLLMTIPFVIVHFLRVEINIGSIFGYLCFTIPITIIFLKKGLFVSILVHSLYGILQYIF